MAKNDSSKLKQINKLINQFASTIKHKPFVNDLDKARVLGFISSLRDVITSHGTKPLPSPPKVYQGEIVEPASKETREEAMKQAKQIIRRQPNDGSV